jgi:SAM-dependent methyltransferase
VNKAAVMETDAVEEKAAVRSFWDKASCGESLYLQGQDKPDYERQAATRYRLEPYIPAFAGFDRCGGQDVLEIGVGLGADHQRLVEGGAHVFGLDLTPRAIAQVRTRFRAFGLEPALQVGDAERLAFGKDTFDMVYSWGVLHHTPDTPASIREVWRVLRTGGEARVMIYHRHSLVAYMLWLRYGLGRLRPFTRLSDICAQYLESPGTKAYTVDEARTLFSMFREVEITTVLTHGDLLSSGAGQRHSGWVLAAARGLWPRRLIERFLPGHGLFMLVRAVK